MIARACADARAGERAAAARKASFERSAGSAEPQYHAACWDEILPSSRRVGGIVASEGMLVLRNLSIPTQLHAALRKCARHRARRNRGCCLGRCSAKGVISSVSGIDAAIGSARHVVFRFDGGPACHSRP